MVFEYFFKFQYGTFDIIISSELISQTKVDCVLPKPDGLLSQVMPMSSIEVANAAVCHVMMKVPKVKENEELDCDESTSILQLKKGLG